MLVVGVVVLWFVCLFAVVFTDAFTRLDDYVADWRSPIE